MSNIIPFSELTRQHRLNLLEHKRREYVERENYLSRLRKLLFEVEAQMRQNELEQLELYRTILSSFDLQIAFPDLGDRIGLQRLFREHPAFLALTAFLEERLTAEECYQRLTELKKP